jgi:4-amino-4-deoxy-L-arabinose transferase-like glycosyltransferase
VWLWSAIAILLAGALAWDGRYAMNPDGLSYVEMASNALAQGPSHLINGYWSPLYPVLLMSVYAFHPGPSQEIPAIHLLNWMIFALVTLCFAYFLRRWLASNRSAISGRLERYFVPFAFSVFLLGSAQFITVSVVSPDLLMAGFLFFAAGLLCRLASGEAHWKNYAGLGAVLGLACYAKTPMFILGGILVLLLAFALPPQRRFLLTAVVALAFLAVAAPLIVMQSRLAGHLSIGESGPLSYVWCVDGLHPRDVLSDPATAEKVRRPTILSHRPVTVGFIQPAGAASYGLWYDPSYWFADNRTQLHFDLRAQLEAIRKNLVVFGGGVYYMSALCGGALFLLLAGARKRVEHGASRVNLALMAWSCAAFLMYSLVYVDYRYFGAFIVVFWIAAYGMLLRRRVRAVRAGVLGAVACATLIAITALAVRNRPSREVLDDLAVAKGLHEAGIRPGDAIANAGYSFNAYFAHLAGVRIEAQIVDASALWSLDPLEMQKLRLVLAGAGIKAIIARDAPRRIDASECQTIPGTRYHRYCIVHL